MAELYDSLESNDPSAREQALFAALPSLIARALQAPGWSEILHGVNPGDIHNRAALAQLPVTRKSSLKELQQTKPPFGGLNTTPTEQLSRIFMSPGPILIQKVAALTGGATHGLCMRWVSDAVT